MYQACHCVFRVPSYCIPTATALISRLRGKGALRGQCHRAMGGQLQSLGRVQGAALPAPLSTRRAEQEPRVPRDVPWPF